MAESLHDLSTSQQLSPYPKKSSFLTSSVGTSSETAASAASTKRHIGQLRVDMIVESLRMRIARPKFFDVGTRTGKDQAARDTPPSPRLPLQPTNQSSKFGGDSPRPNIYCVLCQQRQFFSAQWLRKGPKNSQLALQETRRWRTRETPCPISY